MGFWKYSILLMSCWGGEEGLNTYKCRCPEFVEMIKQGDVDISGGKGLRLILPIYGNSIYA
jgi:hypothetical protein